MNYFIINISYKKSIAEIDALLEAHRHFLDHYYASGHLIASGPKVPREGGIILARAASSEAIMDIIKQDPFHEHDVANYQVTEFKPVTCCEELKADANG